MPRLLIHEKSNKALFHSQRNAQEFRRKTYKSSRHRFKGRCNPLTNLSELLHRTEITFPCFTYAFSSYINQARALSAKANETMPR
ncbi:hypothetical protein T4B_8691 [Trichinella pseudospiralis]|uniref:Uncharacterized protein n=2 Tax=Trichinella pseudospiralis TaxID=6337 RepID=A0A0V1GLI8_TRIPS|nr:hypothetical protein T4B_8691 [Trichinella pseudospiralis]